MVFCLIGLVVFGILGIFSAKYRELAKEAFACAFDMVRLRPCTTGFDNKMKMKLSTSLSKINPVLGKVIYQYFTLLSWLTILLMVVSLFWVGQGVYNYIQFGNCNGPDTTAFCAFAPETYGNIFSFWTNRPENVKIIPLDGGNELGPVDAPIQLLEVGCFSCPFTRDAQPWVDEVLADYNGQIHFSFKYLPIPRHAYSQFAAQAAECAEQQGNYWEFHRRLFAWVAQCTSNTTHPDFKPLLLELAADMDYDVNRFEACLDSNETLPVVLAQKQEAIDAGVYGTPTFFVNGRVVVSPKTKQELVIIIEEELAKVKK